MDQQLDHNSTLPISYFVLTYIGCSLSVVGTTLVLITYGIFRTLRTIPSLILMNLCATILASNLVILIGGPVTKAFPITELCITTAVGLHFSILAQITWMTIMSFQMTRGFYLANKMVSTSRAKSRKYGFIVYLIIGWSVPLLIIAVAIIVHFTALPFYGIYEDESGAFGFCWIDHFEASVVSVALPLAIAMAINITLFVLVTVLLCQAARNRKQLDQRESSPYARYYLAMSSVTGPTWLFAFITLLPGGSWGWYPFIVFNSIQGFVIFVAFVCTRRVLKMYWNLVSCHRVEQSMDVTVK